MSGLYSDVLLSKVWTLFKDCLRALDADSPVVAAQSTEGPLGIQANLRLWTLEEFLSNPGTSLEESEREPLIDVFEGKREIKVLVLLPGIRKEDITARFDRGRLSLEIRRGTKVYRNQMRCAVDTRKVVVRSSTSNNSVVELVFDKVRKKAPS